MGIDRCIEFGFQDDGAGGVGEVYHGTGERDGKCGLQKNGIHPVPVRLRRTGFEEREGQAQKVGVAVQGSRLGHLLGNMGEVWKLGKLGGIGPIDRYGRVVQFILLMVGDGCLDLGISKANR